ncbi:hypothetical protein H4582DRAFT_1934299 [Lactarius indigo]|nr:hypothetical protein H4582DRAFT_1934299 [Lactarius indigo]
MRPITQASDRARCLVSSSFPAPETTVILMTSSTNRNDGSRYSSTSRLRRLRNPPTTPTLGRVVTRPCPWEAVRADAFEHAYAMRCPTALIAQATTTTALSDVDTVEPLVESTAALLAIRAGGVRMRFIIVEEPAWFELGGRAPEAAAAMRGRVEIVASDLCKTVCVSVCLIP